MQKSFVFFGRLERDSAGSSVYNGAGQRRGKSDGGKGARKGGRKKDMTKLSHAITRRDVSYSRRLDLRLEAKKQKFIGLGLKLNWIVDLHFDWVE